MSTFETVMLGGLAASVAIGFGVAYLIANTSKPTSASAVRQSTDQDDGSILSTRTAAIAAIASTQCQPPDCGTGTGVE